MPVELVAGLFWLLLPVAAASGWFAANKRSNKPQPSSEKIAPEYYKGLRYIINEQPDKAIEVFLKLLEVDGETVEFHLALANLFRRRGEVDRAIRIHQNLIARSTLSDEQRSLALLELGVDYLRSGLLDRAEELFESLLESHQKSRAASYLVEIYQDEKDWDKAINCTRIWQEESNYSELQARIAHYYCQKAEEAALSNDFDEASEQVRLALREDRNSAHANILSGKFAIQRQEYAAALKAFQCIEKNSPQMLSEVIQPMKVCYREMGQSDKFLEYLHTLPAKHTGISQVIELSEYIEESEGLDEAIHFLVKKIDQTPSIRMLDRLVQLSLSREEGTVLKKLECFKSLTSKLVKSKVKYQCHRCGYHAHSMYWQCPACKTWDTVNPRIREL